MTRTHKTVAAIALLGSLAIGSGAAVAQCGGWTFHGQPNVGPGCAARYAAPCAPDCQVAIPHRFQKGPGCGDFAPDARPGFRGPGCADIAPDARPGFRGPGAPDFQRRGPGPKFGFEERLTFLLGSLDLNDSQKAAWNNYKQALENAHDIGKKPGEPKARPEGQQARLEARIETLKAKLAVTEALAKARADLVKVLTPEQAKTLEALEDRAHGRAQPRRPAPAPVAPQGPAPKAPAQEGAV